jgi:glycerophosphoryl diester phosphodiesterase
VRKPLLLGHRGARASRQTQENTLASFELCLEHGCDGFEFDVRQSADGVAVLCHDPVFHEMQIAQTPAERLGLPTLEDVLRAFAARAFLDIELKVSGLEGQTVALLRRYPVESGCFVSSFLPEVLTRMRAAGANVPLGFLYDRQPPLDPLEFDAEWIVPRLHLADEALVERANIAGKKVAVWTLNREEEIRQMMAWGVDAVITDETERMAGMHRQQK